MLQQGAHTKLIISSISTKLQHRCSRDSSGYVGACCCVQENIMSLLEHILQRFSVDLTTCISAR